MANTQRDYRNIPGVILARPVWSSLQASMAPLMVVEYWKVSDGKLPALKAVHEVLSRESWFAKKPFADYNPDIHLF